MNALIRPSLQQLQPYSSARNEFSETASIYLDANENPIGVLNRYPDPYQSELRKVVARTWELPQETIFIGNGSDEIIDLVFRLFCEPSVNKALVFSPTYGMYAVSGSINAVELVECRLTDSFEIDLNAAKKALTDPAIKVAFVCSPNNPTGNSSSETTIDALLDAFSGILVVDEAYIDFSNRASIGQKVNENPRLIVLRTLSKAWGLAGARIGIGIMNPSIRIWFDRIKPPYNVSDLNARAAIEALDNKAQVAATIAMIVSERERVAEALSQLVEIEIVFPSDANFLLVKCIEATALYPFLISKGIVVRNRNQQIPNCLRITIGTATENSTLLAAITSFYTQN